MTLLLVPHEARATSATLWIGAIDEPTVSPADLRLVEPTGAVAPRVVVAWDGNVAGRDRRVAYKRVVVDKLTPGRPYRFELRQGGRVRSKATVTTLPGELPHVGDRPFTILLGSCFARKNDGAGEVGRAYSLLPSDARPHVKVLCGDQVYLDTFGFQTLFSRTDAPSLTDRFIGTYATAWAQEPGFRQLLADGANLFSSDDHDYWNNAPNPSPTAPQTYLPGVAKRWWAVALNLYEVFQRRLDPRDRTFDIGSLSIHVADSRLERTTGTSAFMSDGALIEIERWASSLHGPGCLVLGQLPFAMPAGPGPVVFDWGLPDFRDQYERLVRAVRHPAHSIVVLTGDVHFGRVAVCATPTGAEIVEVVASPLTLIFPLPMNTWKEAPLAFPAEAIPGMSSLHPWTDRSYNLNADHFTTVSFARSGRFVLMRVLAWPIHTQGLPLRPALSFERWLS